MSEKTELPISNAEGKISQANLGTILLMFAWPAAWYSFLIHVIAKPFIPEGGVTPTWVFLSIVALGSGAELVAALILLRREGYQLKLKNLKERIRWNWPKGWKLWMVAILVLVLGLGLSLVAAPANQMLAGVPGFVPPAWWPAASNPTKEITSASDVFPDITLLGNYGFVGIYFLIGLIGNILGEELYYRGYLLPRMRGVFGRWDWIANGVLFTLKHIYQRWLYPGILAGGLAFAFVAGPLRSLPLAMIFHWVGNFLLNIIFLLMAAMGIA